MRSVLTRFTAFVLSIMIFGSACALTGCSAAGGDEARASKIAKKMTLDEKISQMIIPAIRTWNEENITDLNEVPEISEALRRHQYGGVILYAGNITGNEQITRLLYDLQENNKQIENASTHIPYLTAVDEEGGAKVRLTSGTRMIGNMAIGATADAGKNAGETGVILGEELAAVGFNTNFAPVVDVNNNPANPIIGTRSFSDDPQRVAELGCDYAKGLSERNIIASFKHFPGHGDTGVDSHIGTPSVEKTYDEIRETELVPFKAAIDNGAEMIMTAHITYPLIDEERTFGDGVTKGFYPATMSPRILTDILRKDLGFKGVIVTDALEMKAIADAGLVPGENGSVEYSVNIAKETINSGADILLIPLDMNHEQAIDFYDEYIEGIASKVNSGEISEDRINESVKRILTLKAGHGILDAADKGTPDIEKIVAESSAAVGSKEHHETEMEMARQAITVLKNEDGVLPVSKEVKNILLLASQKANVPALQYHLEELKNGGYIDGGTDAAVDYYFDPDADESLHYTDEMKEKITGSDVVIGFSFDAGSAALDTDSPQYKALTGAIEDTHKAGGKFILVSENLPYDAAIYPEADAIVLAYMGVGLDIDPEDKADSGSGMKAVNANIAAAMETIFGANKARGHLPVNVPEVVKNSDGTLSYGEAFLYERGAGIIN